MYINSRKDMSDYGERDIPKTSEDNAQESMNNTAEEPKIISPRAIELVPSERYLLPQYELSECPERSTQPSGRKLLSHSELPEWLRGNEFLSHFHRPPMPSFTSCFKSIFKIHSETGNIWTHLIGFIIFICITSYMLLRPITAYTPFPKDWQEKLIFGCFFAGAILCLGISWVFHTVYCHSKVVSKIFRR